MYIVGGIAALVVGALFYLGRDFIGALNELSNAVVTGKSAAPQDRKAWSFTPMVMGIGFALLGVGLIVYGLVMTFV